MLRRALVLLSALSFAWSAPALATRDEAVEALNKGAKAQLAGEYGKARGLLNEAIKADPEWWTPYPTMALTMLEMGNGQGAALQLEKARKLGQKPSAQAHLLAYATLLQGEPEEALNMASDRKIDPRFEGYAARVRALAFEQLGQIEPAGREYDRAVRLNPRIRGLWADVASFRFRMGDVAGAIDAATREVQNAPRSQRAMMLMGDLIRGRYGLVAALPWFRRAVLLEPGNLDALGELAATLGDAGQTVEMLRVTRKMIDISPQNPRAFFLQAVMAARARKPDLARALLYRTGGQMDDVPAVILLNAVLEIQSDSPELAIARLEKLISLQPDNLKARRLLGAAMWRAGDAPGAVSVLKRLAARTDADSYTLSVIGRAYEAQGNRKQAAEYFDRATRGDLGEARPFEMEGDLLRLARASAGPSDQADQGVPYINKMIVEGNFDAAIAHAQRLARLNPGAPAAQMLEGDTYAAVRRYPEAITAYKRAADLRFNEPVALRMIDALMASGNQVEALRVLDYFLSQNPRSVPGLLLAGDHFMATGQWDRAVEVLTGLRERLGNRDAAVLSNLGWAWFNKGNPDKALTYAGEAYAMMPSNANFASTYGWILFKTKRDPAGGVAMMRKAVTINPGNLDLHFQLGQALQLSGDKAGAREHLMKAASEPNFPGAMKAQALLKQG
jgi:tetratricopeptide (TPR) repeat protein